MLLSQSAYIKKADDIRNISNPEEVQKKAYKYLGKDADLYLSDKKDKKYMILDPYLKKFIHFGSFGYSKSNEDFTYHKDIKRQTAYLNRATNIRGNWLTNKYSPNNLAINILW
jgi:hypothetical protein